MTTREKSQPKETKFLIRYYDDWMIFDSKEEAFNFIKSEISFGCDETEFEDLIEIEIIRYFSIENSVRLVEMI